MHSSTAVESPCRRLALVKVVRQSPGYAMQLTLDIFEFREPGVPGRYPKEFVVEAFRGSRLRSAG